MMKSSQDPRTNKKQSFPAWADRFLAWYCAPNLLEEVQGDIHELFDQNREELGLKKARRHFVWDVLRFFNYSTIRGNRELGTLHLSFAMFFNYLKITLRNMLRFKVYAAINILGLAVGFAVCLLIVLFVSHELSFDAFHKKKDTLYRLCEVQTWEGIIPQRVALSMYPMAPTLKEDFPEVLRYARRMSRENILARHGDRELFVEQVVFTDSSFTDLFDFQWETGDRFTSLDEPYSIVLSHETSMKLFNSVDVLGEELELLGVDSIRFKVTGVLKTLPKQSHIQFDALAAIHSFPEANKRWMENWGGNWINTYLELAPNADIKALEAKFPDYLEKYMGEEGPDNYQLFLQPLGDVHLNSTDITHDYNNFAKFDGKYIMIFFLLAIFVLVIAGINFTNLSISRSALRAREVGVRKTIGATRTHLSWQFLLESMIFSFLSLLLALGIVAALLPLLNDLSQRNISLEILIRPDWLAALGGSGLLVGLLAGSYPAWIMARFNPIKALRKGTYSAKNRFTLQNSLVVFQFMVAIAMIVGTLLTTQQLQFMTGKDIGFNRDQVLLLPGVEEIQRHYAPFRENLLQVPGVERVTYSGQRLGNNIHQRGIKFKADTATQELAISHLNIDFDYIDLYEIEVIKGRNFDRSYASDTVKNFIINETLAAKLGYEDPIGKPFAFRWQEEWGQIIGVVKDFNYNTLHHGINPIALSISPSGWVSEVSIKVEGGDIPATLAQIEEIWNQTGTKRSFEYEFLDEHFDDIYRTDTQVSQTVGLIAGIAIFIACLGLFGLISVMAERRVKEIGIRKVLGASVSSILVMLSQRVLGLIVISLGIAIPLTWWFMNGWLQNFAYRISISPWIFVGAGLSAIGLALLTISIKAWQAASADPVEALRTE